MNAGHNIECSAVAPTTKSTSVHVRSFVLRSSALRRVPPNLDLKLIKGDTIAELSCARPAGYLLFVTQPAGNDVRGQVDISGQAV